MPGEIRLKRLERLALQRASEVVLFELSDPRLTLVTLTRVELSADLSHGTVYWSVFGDDAERSKVEHALRDASPVVQSEIAKVFHTRRTPQIHFRFDKSIAGSQRVSSLLADLARERRERGEGGEEE